jgi:hypothetical protein
MERFIVQIRDDLRHNWDRIFIGTGERGVGKSTLFILMNKLIDYSFGWDRLAFNPDQLIPIFRKVPMYSAVQVDEAGEVLNIQEWANRISLNITKQFIGDRYLCLSRSLLLPEIFLLNPKIVGMARYWIRVYSPDDRLRGYAEVRKIRPRDYVYKRLPFAPVEFEIEFDDLPKDISESYQRVKALASEQRSIRYGAKIQEEMDGKKVRGIELDLVLNEVFGAPRQFMSEGKFDANKIYFEYEPEGLGWRRAIMVAKALNEKALKESA